MKDLGEELLVIRCGPAHNPAVWLRSGYSAPQPPRCWFITEFGAATFRTSMAIFSALLLAVGEPGSRPLLRVTDRFVVHADGMILALKRMDRRALTIASGCGREIEVRLIPRTIKIDDVPAGEFSSLGNDLFLKWSRPQPELLGVCVMLFVLCPFPSPTS